jgi:hypothetical protein
LLYLWVTVGVTVATHFCGGEPVSATVMDGRIPDSACCCGEEGETDGCCSTSVTTLVLADAHTMVSGSFPVSVEAAKVASPVESFVPDSPQILPAEAVHPPGQGIPTHILTCSFLI